MKQVKYEFVIPSQVCIVDPNPWPTLQVARESMVVGIEKPLAGTKHIQADNTLGNEGVVVEYSIFRAVIEIDDDCTRPEWFIPFQICSECMSWIRVAASQYWLGMLMSYSDSFARGSIITTQNGVTTFENFGASKMRIPPTPLTIETWNWVGKTVQLGLILRTTDLLFCDAQLSFRDDDYFQAVIRLGIACELELNALIDDLIATSCEATGKLYKASRHQFDWKLRNMPAILGVEPYQAHDERFTNLLCQLYELRGAAVHRAQISVQDVNPTTGKRESVPIGFSHASQFLFAVDDFLNWTQEKRQQAGLLVPDSFRKKIPYMIGPATAK